MTDTQPSGDAPRTTDTFAGLLGAVIHPHLTPRQSELLVDYDIRDDILAMPEMRAVREFIVRIHAELLDGGENPTTALRSVYGLPDSVIEWALA